MSRSISRNVIFIALACAFIIPGAYAQSPSINPEAQRIINYWTKTRIAGAIPRDLVLDERGLGYLRRPDGSLQPHGHNIQAQ